ncbi:MAG: MBL fold metallo-hydrolase [Desulfovibrionaceae bacterium]|nr:MBL fold metallo-hydrolase [Desulfovibrionaceae bacterium]
MPITVFPIGPLQTNCYVVHKNGDALVVDPGGRQCRSHSSPSLGGFSQTSSCKDSDAIGGLDEVVSFLKENALSLRAVLLTHLHFDHIYGAAELMAGPPPVTAYASAGDFPLLEVSASHTARWGLPPVPPFTPEAIAAGPCQFGSITGEIRMTPGHSPGSLALYLPEEGAVISGDTLFYRSIGRTDLAGGDAKAIQTSIQEQLFTLPDETRVFPGHGPSTTIGGEKKHNPCV